jgi:hypothetical protein
VSLEVERMLKLREQYKESKAQKEKNIPCDAPPRQEEVVKISELIKKIKG